MQNFLSAFGATPGLHYLRPGSCPVNVVTCALTHNHSHKPFSLMKKFLLLSLLALGGLTASAQRTPHAIGFHVGGATVDFEYQYHFSQRNFLDVTAGVFDLGDGGMFQGTYNWNVWRSKDWTPNFAQWKFWAGFGGGVGFYDYDHNSGALLGPVGVMGFGFTVREVPLTVGIDYRPMIAMQLGDDSGLNAVGFRNIGLTLTYRF